MTSGTCSVRLPASVFESGIHDSRPSSSSYAVMAPLAAEELAHGRLRPVKKVRTRRARAHHLFRRRKCAQTIDFTTLSATACRGTDQQQTESTSAALSGCAWGDGNYTRVGDVNHDFKMDLMSPVGATVNTYETLSPTAIQYIPTSTPANWGSGPFTWAADFDLDGHADLASANGGTIYLHRSLLDTSQSYTADPFMVNVAWGPYGYTFVGDFTHDGVPDIATASGTQITILAFDPANWSFHTFTNTVLGSWGGPNCGPQCGTASGYTWAGDFDGDGVPDIASGNGANIEFNQGDPNHGGFTRSHNFTVSNANWGQSGYTFAGLFTSKTRASVASASGANVYIKEFNGTSWTGSTRTLPNASWGSSDFTWVGDFNGDGFSDIASASGTSVYMKLSTPSGTSFFAATWNGPPSWGSTQFTRVADFTGDGKADILTAVGCSLYLLESNGSNFNLHLF